MIALISERILNNLHSTGTVCFFVLALSPAVIKLRGLAICIHIRE